jgi:ubiquinone/menaquinone biosynthesis C-methylase UbiE
VEAHDPHEHKATAHHPFDDIKKWVGVFDDPGRDRWQKPGYVVEALGLKPGQRVADIGAGTGYFNRHLARAVGRSGKVYAVDIEPEMVEHMRQRAERERTPQVEAILGARDDPRLPGDGVDLVLIVDTYHHIDDRVRYLRRLARRLRQGGRVAIVDFEKRELPVGPPLEHKLSRDEVVAEFVEAGYRLRAEPGGLPYQYFLVFEPGRGRS